MYSFEMIEKHPNPQNYRKDFFSLDGEWEFAFDKENKGLSEGWFIDKELPLNIRVPFVYQSKLSGVDSDEFCEVVWYKRSFEFGANFFNKRTILHFAAVDYECDVWVNGKHATHHIGGYSSFKVDITELLHSGENEISLRVVDRDFAKENIRGKQLWGKGEFGCWYKRYTGIWQSVWLEAVSRVHIDKFILRGDVDTNTVSLKAELKNFLPDEVFCADIEITVNDISVAHACFDVYDGYIDEKINVDYRNSPFRGSEWWSPEHPNLYQMLITLKSNDEIMDELQTYFGMRKIEASNGRVLLNNFPFYHRSVLNQGYYPDGYITPEDDERIISDIKLIKSMGYNAMRIHQKIESPRFLYWCDRIGIAVWEEIPSMYHYRELQAHNIMSEMTSIVERDINHPAITAWVLFNESWGVQQIRFDSQQQNLTKGAYFTVKSMDPTRFVISNDGWQQTETDLVTIHDYSAYGDEIFDRYNNTAGYEIGENPVAGQRRFAFAEGHSYSGQPVMLTEFGGISYAADGGWGYNDKVKTEEEFIERFKSLTHAIRKIPYMTGYCFTQFTDVENEQNGLVTINREPKADLQKIRKINLGAL
ncbi:MAG: glycoside hydrolase family 2 [Ruminococcaceae bacterium]|nr:glycoside hydrolase family 2 [Oscillospiraceae bacterium]